MRLQALLLQGPALDRMHRRPQSDRVRAGDGAGSPMAGALGDDAGRGDLSGARGGCRHGALAETSAAHCGQRLRGGE